MHNNINTVKLGKLSPKFDNDAVKFAQYASQPIIVPESVENGITVKEWGMMRNDKIGCCTAAGAAHLEMLWTSEVDNLIYISDDDVLKFYSNTTGYDPSTPHSDRGGIAIDILNYWKTNGFVINNNSHKINGWAELNIKNPLEIKAGIYWFGGIYVGVELPLSAQNQMVWDITNPFLLGDATPGSWGGHCVILIGYNEIGPIAITWGIRKQMTWGWWRAYSDEAYAVLSIDYLNKNGTTPDGFNLIQLEEDLKILD